MRHSYTALLIALLLGTPALAQQVTKPELPGVRNYAKLETTVACAGAISAEQAVPAIKKEGFVSIVNLREASEPGANVEQEESLARAAGLKYFHVPFNGASPDPKAADAFIAAITSPGAEPAFIHCSGGNRAATMTAPPARAHADWVSYWASLTFDLPADDRPAQTGTH